MSNIARAFVASIAFSAAMVIPSGFGTAAAAAASVDGQLAAAHHEDQGSASPRRWVKYRDFDSLYMCEAVGASGAFVGRWSDWHCDDENTLWVDR